MKQQYYWNEYLFAWAEWISGNKLPDDTVICIVWCWKIFIWARWGKVVQLISAMTIIADILGPAKLRKIGSKLGNIFSLSLAKSYILELFMWIKEFLSRCCSGYSELDLEKARIDPQKFYRERYFAMANRRKNPI